MDDQALAARCRNGLAHEQRLLGSHAPRARVLEHEGVVGAIVPSVPDTSIANAVVALAPAALTAPVIEDLHAAYTDAGVRKWGVWLDPEDVDGLAALSAAGLVFDSHPMRMAAVIADLDLDDAPPAETVTAREAGHVNDLAYGHADGRLERMLEAVPAEVARSYGARDDDGDLVATVTVTEYRGDTAVWMVATVPWARNQGHARRLMRRALVDSRDEGCKTTTLIASALGRPVYDALGYRPLGEMHLWERRS